MYSEIREIENAKTVNNLLAKGWELLEIKTVNANVTLKCTTHIYNRFI